MNGATTRISQHIPDCAETPRCPSPQSGHIQTKFQVARNWLALGNVIADVPESSRDASRLAHLNVSFGLLAHPQSPWAARFWEADPPPGAQAIEWLFGSKASVSCLEDALALLDKTRGLVTTYAVT